MTTNTGGLLPKFEYHDFLSTSKSKKQAMKFLNKAQPTATQNQRILFELEMDDTAVCADVSWISKDGHEEEVLFAPTKWRKRPEGIILHAEGDGQSCNYVVAHYQLRGAPRKDWFPGELGQPKIRQHTGSATPMIPKN